MSIKSAARFLSAASHNQEVRDRFSQVNSPQDFLGVSQDLGYSFTTAELRQVVQRKSRHVKTRRNTGIWRWLRNINWVE